MWDRIEAEIAGQPNGKGREVAWLAEKLKLRVQTINNWKSRGVPADRHQAIAAALAWSIDELLDAPTPNRPAWPLSLISPQRWARLTERQKGAAESEALKVVEKFEAQAAEAEHQGATQTRELIAAEPQPEYTVPARGLKMGHVYFLAAALLLATPRPSSTTLMRPGRCHVISIDRTWDDHR